MWTKEGLQELVRAKLNDYLFITVSNREPYMHNWSSDGVKCSTPASGLTVALDPVMQACGGTWIAYGDGNADWDVVDSKSRIMVPPDDPKYTLRRVWLSKAEI